MLYLIPIKFLQNFSKSFINMFQKFLQNFVFCSIYAGLSVLINFIFMITWILSGIIISTEWPYIPVLHCGFSRNVDVIYENILTVKSTFDHYVVRCIEKYNYTLIIVMGVISAVSMFSVLCWPRLQVPDSSEFQLFEKKHPIEQYDLIFKDRFRFSHAYSVSICLKSVAKKLCQRILSGSD